MLIIILVMLFVLFGLLDQYVEHDNKIKYRFGLYNFIIAFMLLILLILTYNKGIL